MDKILYRNPSKSEIIGRCGGKEKTEWTRRTDKSRTQKKKKKGLRVYSLVLTGSLDSPSSGGEWNLINDNP